MPWRSFLASSIRYFDEELLRWWIELLRRPEFKLAPYLPPSIDDYWYAEVINVVELLKLGAYPDELHAKAAYLFYKLIKNHRFPDGNKRSAILALYLFYFLNDYSLTESYAFIKSAGIRNIAKNVAKQSPRFHERSVHKLAAQFQKIALPDAT